MKVIKRDGSEALYNPSKILKSLYKTNERTQELSNNDIDKLLTIVNNKVSKLKEPVAVEDIQDIVEDTLLKSKFNKTAKSYILYRDERTRNRQRKSRLLKEIAEKINATNIVNQNANIDEMSFGGRKGEADSVLMKDFALKYCVSEMARNNHINNEVYIHDLDAYAVGMHNCLSVPFDKLLAEGFNTRQTDVRPASSINTAFQLVAVIFQLQSLQQFGGVSATHLDWTMVPYVRKSFAKHFNDGLKYVEEKEIPSIGFFAYDSSTRPIDAQSYKQYEKAYSYALDMTQKELDQAVEGMYHNLNTLQSRSGNQLPFTSINYGTCTLLEGRMITKALLVGSIKGVGKVHKTAIFPCGIFQYMKGVNDKPGTPNYDLFKLALESTSKRLYPNYANVDWSNNVGYDVNDPKTYFSTMGCRTANGADINAEPGTNPQTKDGRGNLAPVTIILPTLAMEANRDIDKFMELLDRKIHEAKDMLLERYEYMCSQSPESAKFMYENGTMIGYHKEQGIQSALKHGTLVIGQLALAETLQLLVGCNHTKPEGMKLAKRIEQLFKDRCAEFKQEWHYLKSAPSKDEIKEIMIKNAESKLGRKLTEEEKNIISKYKK